MAFQGIRDKMNQNQKPFIIGGVVMVCVALGLLVWELKPVSAVAAPNSYYFYDTSSGSVTTEPASEIPPLKGANGRDTLVLAKFFTCTACGDKKLGYLVKYTPTARSVMRKLASPLPANATPEELGQRAAESAELRMSIASGKLVRLPLDVS